MYKTVKILNLLILGAISIMACSQKKEKPAIVGTWKLITGTTIKGKDTLTTDYTKTQEMIKLINETHFAFLRHDLKNGKDSTAVFVAGGGRCTFDENKYTEHLDYFNVRAWEGNRFEFEYSIHGDTLITRGLELDYINIEQYCRVGEW